ncbi:MAG: phospho-sugar mutase [Clostridia bacterium]|nr:phospho-sugar mutase [Clostridia bacterium]
MDYVREYERWLASPVLSEEERAALRATTSEEEKELAFGRTLEFGTAGLRSSMALGPGRMNVYTVAHATRGIAGMIRREGGATRGCAIGYDSRHNSALFAHVAARVLAEDGIRVYLFDGLRPTPELSFAVRRLGCAAGINVTASHNPREYNGYKAYAEDGCQLSPEAAAAVAATMAELDVLVPLPRLSLEEAVAEGLVTLLGEDFDEEYLAAVEATVIDRALLRRAGETLSVVYTPLHGAGRRLVPEILSRVGLRHVYPVPEQMIPDGDFPTVVKPNPEYAEVFTLGIALAERVGSDIVIATDPDSDRVGVVARTAAGGFATISGNQMGALLLDYIIGARRRLGTLPTDAYAIKSIVSTDLVSRICEKNGVRLYDVLTGFKYIGEVIKDHEATGNEQSLLLGFEESYGYLPYTAARDKDAVAASLLIAEMTAYYEERGMTLCDALSELDERYGIFREKTTEIYMEGLDGLLRQRRVMETLRKTPPTVLGGRRVVSIGDYRKGYFTNVDTGERTAIPQPESNVLYFITEDDDKVVIRPSGTEPKIKLYFLVHAPTEAEAEEKLAALTRDTAAFSRV